MKNKKGFTLIEMLLTGTLLVVIAIIIVPNIVSTYKRAKENEYQRFLNDLFLSTEAYVQKYTDEYEDLKNVDGKAYIYVDELLDSRYLKSTLYDTKNKKHIKDESDFTIEVTKKEDGSYVYKLYEEHYTPEICEYDIGKEWTFDYTGSEQEFSVPCSGNYKIELWGAQGGNATTSYVGGYGAYSKGTINFRKDNQLYINVGGKGSDNGYQNNLIGGYNGGGDVIAHTGVNHQYGSGGGATHIATKRGLLGTLNNDIDSIIMVAGSGGGARYQSNITLPNSNGCSGGGVAGNSITSGSYTSNGGTQTAPGTGIGDASYWDIYAQTGVFGQGANMKGSASAGAGYYGGGASYIAAGGGSSYIGNPLLTNKEMYCYNCTESNEISTKTISTTNVSTVPIGNYAKSGNGYAKITYLGDNTTD